MSITHGKVQGASPHTVILAGNATFGASGAVSSANTPGFVFADSGTTGEYTITPDEEYNALLSIAVTRLDSATAGDGEGDDLWMVDTDYTSNVITLRYVANIGGTEALADPPSGDKIYITAVFQRGVARPSST